MALDFLLHQFLHNQPGLDIIIETLILNLTLSLILTLLVIYSIKELTAELQRECSAREKAEKEAADLLATKESLGAANRASEAKLHDLQAQVARIDNDRSEERTRWDCDIVGIGQG